MGLDILNVFLTLLVQMLGSWSFSVAAILEICKLGVFHPGNVGELFKKLQWGILNLSVDFGLCPHFFHSKSQYCSTNM